MLILPLALISKKQGAKSYLTFSSLSLLGNLGNRQKDLAGRISFILLSLFILFASISLARPQKENSYTERKASGIDIIITMDVSLSMEIPDFKISGRPVPRFEISRSVVQEFIEQRPNDRIGLVPFAGQPYQESPITLEHDWLLDKVKKVKPRRELVQGTAIGSAISASAIRLDKRKDTKSRIIVLLTDGSNNSGKLSPEQAAQAAKTLGIKIYTVAIGSEDGRLSGYNTGQEFDTETLEGIAKITGGEYYRAKSTNDLVSAFQSIDTLEKTERKDKVVITYEELHHYFTLAAILSLFASLLTIIFYQPAGPN